MNKPFTATAQGIAPVKLPHGKLCDVRAGLGVRLIQQGKDLFAVVYGRQIKERLNYAEAASEYGACIMHALACDGKLDNRKKGEV